ncbi:MAG: tRNA lysidine(34) synthetase TilS [Hyphomonadaceae bacterium]
MTYSISADPGETRLAGEVAGRAHGAFGLLLRDDARIALAVSGGSDSMAALHLLAPWARRSGKTLIAATVDHGLRPEAANEARMVARVCAGLGVAHRTLVWRPPKTPVSQADARSARHRLLAEWAAAETATALVMAHTADDRMETFLIRARAGSHLHGLAAPLPCAPSPAALDGAAPRIVRPLLWARREELRDVLRAGGLGWADDPSNRNAAFERVRMRALLAALAEDDRRRLLAILNRLAVLRAAQVAGARRALAEAVDWTGTSAAIAPEALRALPEGVRLRLVEAIVMAVGGAGKRPSTGATARLVARLTGEDAAAASTLAGVVVRRGSARIRFRPAPPRRTSAAFAARIHDETPSVFAAMTSARARAAALLQDPQTRALTPVAETFPAISSADDP